MNPLNAPASEQYCVFLVGGIWFALPATLIREVAAKPTIAAVPLSNSALAGLCHEGSEFLPVIRLPSRLSSNEPAQKPCSLERQMLVLNGPNGPWGLLIDQVHGIESLECSHDAEGYCDDWSTAVMGTSAWQDQIVRILHADGLYRLAEQMLKRDWSKFSHQLALAAH